MGFFSDALTFVAKNVAEGALSEVGTTGAGWVLSSIFGNQGGSNQQLANEIQQIGNQLTSIQTTLDQLKAQLATAFGEIQQELKEINQEELYLAWQQRNSQLQIFLAQIDTQYTLFTTYAQNANTTSQAEIAALVDEIKNSNNGAGVSLRNVQEIVRGAGLEKGVLQLWAEMVTPLVAQSRISYSTAAQSYLNYHTNIIYGALRAINLLVEAFNQQGNHPVASSQFSAYQANMAALEAPFLVQLERIAYAAMRDGATWTTIKSDRPVDQLHYDYWGVIQYLYASGWFATEYQPSVMRRWAEEILYAAQALGAAQRRIVVWMLHPGNIFFPQNVNFDSAAVQLISGTSDATISPDASATLINEMVTVRGPASRPALPQQRLIKRFVFGKTLTDGPYSLADNTSFPTNEGSNQQTDYFMDGLYLDYTLQVSGDSPFDFMDFATYIDPNPLAWSSFAT
jgi:hypothetical protein